MHCFHPTTEHLNATIHSIFCLHHSANFFFPAMSVRIQNPVGEARGGRDGVEVKKKNRIPLHLIQLSILNKCLRRACPGILDQRQRIVHVVWYSLSRDPASIRKEEAIFVRN